MIALGLVQNLVDVADAPYDQLLAVIGGRADLTQEGIPGVVYPVAVRVRLAARVNRVYHLEAVRTGGERAEQKRQEDREAVSRWQPHSHGDRVIRGSTIRYELLPGAECS